MFKSQLKPKYSKSILISLSLIVSCFLLRMDVNSMIYSRIQGEVFDNDSGSPIADAEVILLNYNYKFKAIFGKRKTKTDKLGKFVFNDIIPGYYFVKTNKDGFISTIPNYKERSIRGTDLNKLKKMIPYVLIDKEGSIKHIKINLKKGHSIKGQISGINTKDKYGRSLIHINLSRKIDADERLFDYQKKITIEYGLAKPDNSFQFPGLEPRNDYFLAIEVRGFPTQYYDNIDLLTQETAIINCFYNEDDRTGVKGTIKINGKIPEGFSISLNHNLGGDERFYYDYDYQNVPTTYPNGEFSIFMVAPGKYYIHVFAFDKNYQEYKRDSLVEVKKDETSIINIDFRSE